MDNESVVSARRHDEMASIENQLRLYERAKRQHYLDRQTLARLTSLRGKDGDLPGDVDIARDVIDRIADYEAGSALRKVHIRQLLERLAEIDEGGGVR